MDLLAVMVISPQDAVKPVPQQVAIANARTIQMNEQNLVYISIEDLIIAQFINKMSKELKDDFLNIIEGMDLIDEYGNRGSQLAKEKLGPDGRPCLNLTVYMVALGKREERQATLAAGTARLKHPGHKSAV